MAASRRRVHGAMAPSMSDSDGSGTMRCSSMNWLKPRPVQAGQAPRGLLKENSCGDSSGTEIPHRWQAADSLNSTSSPLSGNRATMTPSPRATAVLTDSSRRRRMEAFSTSRSMTASIWWNLFLSRTISSPSWRISPSTRTRTNPSLRSRCNTCSCWPFLRVTSGASRMTFSPSGRASRASSMSWIDWERIGSPHLGQWGWPARPKSRRRWS